MCYIMNSIFGCYGVESGNLWYCIVFVCMCYIVNYMIMISNIEIDVEIGYWNMFWV